MASSPNLHGTFERERMPRSRRDLVPRIEAWNRRLHYYSGLLLLPFLLLFVVSGLLLNHPTWRFADFWPKRVERESQFAFQPLTGATELEKARALMSQLGLSGEVEWLSAARRPGWLDFRVDRPGRIVDIHADMDQRSASLKEIDVNGWGAIRALHEFTGVRSSSPEASRDWWLTWLWSISMDVIAAGLIFMTLSSMWMWWRLKRDRRLGFLVIALGAGVCIVLAVGTRLFE